MADPKAPVIPNDAQCTASPTAIGPRAEAGLVTDPSTTGVVRGQPAAGWTTSPRLMAPPLPRLNRGDIAEQRRVLHHAVLDLPLGPVREDVAVILARIEAFRIA